MAWQIEHSVQDIIKDIQPMTTFRDHSAVIMQHLRETKRPVILTVNGKAAVEVQDAEAYQLLLDLAAQANAAEGIRQGLEDARTAGPGRAPSTCWTDIAMGRDQDGVLVVTPQR